MEETDGVLIQRAKEGDAEAFGFLYERYVGKIYNYIFHRTGSHHDAEDLTARTFHRALTGLGRYKDRGPPFSAWLYRIAHNLVANWHRDRSRHQEISLDELIMAGRWGDGDTPDQVVEQGEKERALREAIRRLKPDRQQLLILKFSEGMTNAEIGQVMGRSEGAIKSLYFRTLVALRAYLEEKG